MDFRPDGAKSLARVQSQSERMTALVEDLLPLARLDEGQPLKLSEVDLTQLVIESFSDEKVMTPGHNWRLQPPDEPVVVNGQPFAAAPGADESVAERAETYLGRNHC